MINPLTHARTPEDVATYKVEPYVVAADVYTAEGPARPRRLDLVHGLGELDVPGRAGGDPRLQKRGDTLFIEPRAPAAWPEFSIEYRYGGSLYAIVGAQRRRGGRESGRGEAGRPRSQPTGVSSWWTTGQAARGERSPT